MSAPSSYLTVSLADEHVALPLLQVREVVEPEGVTRVPGSAKALQGVINLRGSIVPVLDLAAALGLREPVTSPATCVVLLESTLDGERTVIALAVDGVDEVVHLAASEVEVAPAFGTKVAFHHLVGLARRNGVFLLLLDVERVLASTLPVAAANAAASSRAAHVAAAQE